MTGKWLLQPANYTQLVLCTGKIFQNPKFPKLILSENKIYFDDSSMLAKIDICLNEKELITRLKSQGPDFMLASLIHHNKEPIINIYQEPITLNKWLSIVNNPRIQTKPIMDLLKENTRVGGIGNYLRAEILYQSKISPYRSLANLSDQDKINIYNSAIDIMCISYSLGGHSIKDYQHPNGEYGKFVPTIYKKEKDPFDNDIVAEKKKGKQIMYWVPKIQI